MHATRVAADPVRLASNPDDYTRFMLEKGRIELWEDGIRLDPAEPNIEWWYFDSILDDGAKLAMIFCTKDGSRGHQPLEPLIEFDLDLPDGRRFMKYGHWDASEFSASKDRCDVHLGPHRFVGDLHEYRISGAVEELSAEVRLEAITEPWRPGTGHVLFGAEGDAYLAWLIAVPAGRVTVTYRVGSEVHETTGMGYHDHNWAGQSYVQMGHLLDHWYWGRGHLGPFAYTTAYLTSGKDYGYATVPLYMLARDGKVIADDPAKVTFSKAGTQIDEHTGKPVPDQVRFEYRDGEKSYVITYTREHTLVSQKNIDIVTGVKKLVAELVRYPGGYLRFSGPVTLDCLEGGEVVEHYEDAGSFEQNYFGQRLHGDT